MVSGTSSPWFIRSLMSGLRSRREDMVSERCRPLLSSMKGVFAPLPCRIYPSGVVPLPLIAMSSGVQSQVHDLSVLHGRWRCMKSQGVGGKGKVHSANAMLQGRDVSHRARSTVEPHDLSRTLHPLQAGIDCLVTPGISGAPALTHLHFHKSTMSTLRRLAE